MSNFKKQLIVFIVFCLLLTGIVLAVPALEKIYGTKWFTDGIQIGTDPNNAWTSAGNITAKNIYSNGEIVPGLDPNGCVDNSAVYDKHTNLTATSLNLGNASIDPNGSISAAPDTDTTFTFGRGKMGYNGTISDAFCVAHYDFMTNTNYALKQTSSGDVTFNAPNGMGLYFAINSNQIATITSTAWTFESGKTLNFKGNLDSSILMNRHSTANTGGNILTLQSGGATASATDKAGGNLLLKSGISTGNGGSQIDFYGVDVNQGAGTTDRNPTLTASITGTGLTMATAKNITLSGGGNITVNGLNELKNSVATPADPNTPITTIKVVSGFGEVICGSEYQKFRTDPNGTVLYDYKSLNSSNTKDTASNLNVYNDPNMFLCFQNKTGVTANIKYKVNY